MLSMRIMISALAACLLFASTAAQSTYTLCYTLTGLPSSTLDDPYSIAVLVSGTYDPTLRTSTAGKYTPAGQYYLLTSATGTRTIATRNGITVVDTIAALLPAGSDYSNNHFYISNATFPQFVDADGLTFNLSSPSLFPGKTVSSFWNLYRSGIYGAVLEDKTSGLDLTQFSLSTSGFAGWTGNQYTGTCAPPALETPGSSTTPLSAGTTYNVELAYNLASQASDNPQWTVSFDATFTSDGNVYGPDQFGDNWLVLNGVTSGTRTYCIVGGACSTSNVVAVAPIGAFGFADDRVYPYYPYLSYNGLAYTLDVAQPKPGYVNTNTSALVNPYVSKAGAFYEGFGNGGTGPNGYADNSQTSFSVTITSQ